MQERNEDAFSTSFDRGIDGGGQRLRVKRCDDGAVGADTPRNAEYEIAGDEGWGTF